MFKFNFIFNYSCSRNNILHYNTLYYIILISFHCFSSIFFDYTDMAKGRGDTFDLASPIVIGFISLIIGTAFYVLGYFSTGWYKLDYLGQDFSEGLWEICISRPSVPGL